LRPATRLRAALARRWMESELLRFAFNGHVLPMVRWFPAEHLLELHAAHKTAAARQVAAQVGDVRVMPGDERPSGSSNADIVGGHVEGFKTSWVQLNPGETGRGHVAGVDVGPQAVRRGRVIRGELTEPPFIRPLVHDALGSQRGDGDPVPARIVLGQYLQI